MYVFNFDEVQCIFSFMTHTFLVSSKYSSGGSGVKASAWNAGDPGSIPGSGRSPEEGKWQPTPVLLPGESHGGTLQSMESQRVGHD